MTSNAGAPVWKNTGCPGSPAPSACMDKNGSVSASMKAQIPKLSADCWTGHLEIRTGSRGKALEGHLKNRKEPTTRVQDGRWEIRTGSPEKDQEKKVQEKTAQERIAQEKTAQERIAQEKTAQEAAICTFWAETLSHGKSVFPKAEPAEQTAERIQLLQILSPVRTVLPEANTSPAYSENTSPAYSDKKYYQDSLIPGFNGNGLPAREDEILSTKPPGSKPVRDDEILPEKIRGMKRLYKYGDGTFRERSMNFYIQGKYMEDYEDDVPWHGDFRRYFPTYHDLRNDQLRGYFTWRTDIRRGIFKKVPDSVVYIYIYELLNVIGASSPEESLQKLKEFEEGYLGPERTGSEGSGAGAAGPVSEKEGENAIRQNLHKWMLEFAVLHGVDPETACRYADPEMIQRDHFLEVLRDPRHFEDREVFDALCLFAGSKITSSPVIKKTEEGIPLFAKAWRYACSHFNENGRELFNHCFGDLKTKVWFPLENVMYGARRPSEPVSYILNPCRKYTFDGRFWKESSYLKILFDKKRLTGLLHETDRQLRLYLKAGGRLKEMSDEAWAAPYVQAVIEADRAAKIEAAKPKVHIRFSDLDQIRRDALATRDSLLTEEERQEKYVTTVETALSEYSDLMNSGTNNPQFDNSEKAETSPERSVISAGTEPALDDVFAGTGTEPALDGVFAVTSPNHLPGEKHSADDIKNFSEENRLAGKMEGKEPCSPALPLDENQRDLLLALLRGESVRERITKQHGMPEIVADELNEALFDEIGDSVVECDGDEIILVEDYREDIMELLGEG